LSHDARAVTVFPAGFAASARELLVAIGDERDGRVAIPDDCHAKPHQQEQ
jgi:hypothetical protein